MVKLSGLLIGFAFGFVLERGYFCHFSGFSEAIMFRNFKIVKSTIWAVLIAMLGFHFLSTFGIIALSPKPLFWGGSIVGGLIFGIGMGMIGSCTAGTSFKIGTGLIGYLIAGIAIGFGGLWAQEGFLMGIKNSLQSSKVLINNVPPTLASIFGINSWIVVILLSFLFIILLVELRTKETREENLSLKQKLFERAWPPALTGILIGFIGMLAFIASAKSGRNYPLGIVEGYIPIIKSFIKMDFSKINWMYMLIPGIILGSFSASLLSREFRLRMPSLKQVIMMVVGGILVGSGAVIAAGCSVTHVISGLPQLSIGSLVSAISIFTGVFIVIYFTIIRAKKVSA